MFATRNLYYLRISPTIILPLYLYLDQLHLQWMTDSILQMVLQELKPLIGPKLAKEGETLLQNGSKNPKATVDVVRGDSYQFAFFFRKMEQHDVLIKQRNFTEVKVTSIKQMEPKAGPTAKHAKGRKRVRVVESDSDISMVDANLDPQDSRPRRSIRRKVEQQRETDEEIEDANASEMEGSEFDTGGEVRNEISVKAEPSDTIFLANQDDDDKTKLKMSLSFTGFHIPGTHVCVIVEPYPPLSSRDLPRAGTMEPPEIRFQAPSAIPRLRELSVAPEAQRFRSQTPLFLPDEDHVGRTPLFRTPVEQTIQVLHGSDKDENEEDEQDGLLLFSQALASVTRKEGRMDDMDDDDYLRGDADEDQRVIE